MPTLEGGNAVDEGLPLAPADRTANLVHPSANPPAPGKTWVIRPTDACLEEQADTLS